MCHQCWQDTGLLQQAVPLSLNCPPRKAWVPSGVLFIGDRTHHFVSQWNDERAHNESTYLWRITIVQSWHLHENWLLSLVGCKTRTQYAAETQTRVINNWELSVVIVVIFWMGLASLEDRVMSTMLIDVVARMSNNGTTQSSVKTDRCRLAGGGCWWLFFLDVDTIVLTSISRNCLALACW